MSENYAQIISLKRNGLMNYKEQESKTSQEKILELRLFQLYLIP